MIGLDLDNNELKERKRLQKSERVKQFSLEALMEIPPDDHTQLNINLMHFSVTIRRGLSKEMSFF